MKRLLLLAFATLLLFTLGSAAWYYSKLHNNKGTHKAATISSHSERMIPLKEQAGNILAYAKKNNYNTQQCFLVNMNINSGTNRFFVYDLKKDSLLDAGLVAHGRCNENWLTGRKYGNAPGCGCTSLGKYKVGKPYKGRFGLAYKLYGLDSTNNNAFKRFVVSHSHSCMPDKEVDPYPVCQSDGCPMVSPIFLNKLAGIIDGSSKPILLYTFDGN